MEKIKLVNTSWNLQVGSLSKKEALKYFMQNIENTQYDVIVDNEYHQIEVQGNNKPWWKSSTFGGVIVLFCVLAIIVIFIYCFIRFANPLL